MPLDHRRGALAAWLLALVGLVGLGLGPGASPARAADELTGTFRISSGRCSGGSATGSYFRMVQPTGTTKAGPWVDNADSSCSDGTYTLLSPGTDGGLVTGNHQPAPSPGFDGSGNSRAARIVHPVRFFGVDFSASTNPIDLQSGTATAAPTLRADGGSLSGDLSAFAATWNNQAFNQGAPKPGGTTPGGTLRASGTYNPATHAFSVTWASQIVGGPFNGFTGLWHLEGTFVPAIRPSAAVPPVAAGGSATSTSIALAATAPPGDTATTAAPATGGSPLAAPSAPAESGATELRGVHVEDDGFRAPTWLVLLLAGLGIAGVVAPLLGGRAVTTPEGSSTTS